MVLRSGFLYFALVFTAGFVLGAIRVTLVVPHLGARSAELLEAPVMILIIFLAARWVVRRHALPNTLAKRLSMGLIGMALMLAAEFGFVLWLRGITLNQYLSTRDPVSGTAYYIALGMFALMPVIVERN